MITYDSMMLSTFVKGHRHEHCVLLSLPLHAMHRGCKTTSQLGEGAGGGCGGNGGGGLGDGGCGGEGISGGGFAGGGLELGGGGEEMPAACGERMSAGLGGGRGGVGACGGGGLGGGGLGGGGGGMSAASAAVSVQLPSFPLYSELYWNCSCPPHSPVL